MSAENPTAEEKIAARLAAVAAKRETLRAELAAAHAEQQATDLEALALLEEEHGFDRVVRIDLNGWKAGVGAATMVVALVPGTTPESTGLVRRYEQTVAKAKDGSTTKSDALITLGAACVIYPDKVAAKELHAATLQLASGVLLHVGVQVMNVVQGRAEEEKKG